MSLAAIELGSMKLQNVFAKNIWSTEIIEQTDVNNKKCDHNVYVKIYRNGIHWAKTNQFFFVYKIIQLNNLIASFQRECINSFPFCCEPLLFCRHVRSLEWKMKKFLPFYISYSDTLKLLNWISCWMWQMAKMNHNMKKKRSYKRVKEKKKMTRQRKL